MPLLRLLVSILMDALALKIKSVVQIFVSRISALLIALLRSLAPILMAVNAQ